ncbi:hypothetical protein pb186bvf_007441 [Paramecium bursaria]
MTQKVNNFYEKSLFSHANFNQKDGQKHTFYLSENNNYYYIPIFQKEQDIKFRDKVYKVIKLQRRSETYLKYKVQDIDKKQVFSIEYQYIYDDKQNDQDYLYSKDETIISNNYSEVYRQQCRIAIKMQDDHNFLKLTRFIHLRRLNQNQKIKLINTLAHDEQLEQLDYNQICIDEKLKIQRQITNQYQISCFVLAPISISPIINYQQTFLIGFYYALLNNLVIFNQYMNGENNLKQALQNGFIEQQFQLQQLIKGTINYQYKLQIPKKFLQQGIQKIQNQQKIAENSFLNQMGEFLFFQKIKELRKNYDIKRKMAELEIIEQNIQGVNSIIDYDIGNDSKDLQNQKVYEKYIEQPNPDLIVYTLKQIIDDPKDQDQTKIQLQAKRIEKFFMNPIIHIIDLIQRTWIQTPDSLNQVFSDIKQNYKYNINQQINYQYLYY